MMEFAESEPVRLKAATEILDRAGVRGGVEIDTNVNVDVRPAAEVIAERLDRLALGAIQTAARLSEDGAKVIDAEVVIEEEDAATVETFNEEQKDQDPDPEPAVTANGEKEE
jgi:hypothetical protein